MNMSERLLRDLAERARAYDGKEQIDDLQRDPDSRETDDVETLQAGQTDPIRTELESLIDRLDEEAQAELVALYWIGRGDHEAGDFADVVERARARRSGSTTSYLLGAPLLGDYLEMGLDAVLQADVYDEA